jgi:hypothetical protein
MHSLPKIVQTLWGRTRAPRVSEEYRLACRGRELFVRDLALFCNAAAPIVGDGEFERGVEEGKRRVWLHISRMCSLEAADFISIADGGLTDD